MKKVSILSPNLSGNCMARAYVLARMLERRYEVEIVGPVLGRGIWQPIAQAGAPVIRSVSAAVWPSPYWKVDSISCLADGDIIYASKPLLTSLGVAVRVKQRTGKPLILDIDDWETGFVSDRFADSGLIQRVTFIAASALLYYRPGSYWNVLLSEKLIERADAVTVSNTFLKDKYGGTLIRHARNTHELDPHLFDREALRRRHGIPQDRSVVLFLGTPVAYKGIEDLIEAVAQIKRTGVLLMVIGMDSRKSYCRRIAALGRNLLGSGFKPLGFQPLNLLPEFLAMADVFAVPQRMTPATVGQLPAKLFDAMAMAKPIVATSVGDLPQILKDCGRVVEPERPGLLAEAIEGFIADPDGAGSMGERARQECIAKYSYDIVGRLLDDVLNEYG